MMAHRGLGQRWAGAARNKSEQSIKSHVLQDSSVFLSSQELHGCMDRVPTVPAGGNSACWNSMAQPSFNRGSNSLEKTQIADPCPAKVRTRGASTKAEMSKIHLKAICFAVSFSPRDLTRLPETQCKCFQVRNLF